MTVRGRIVSMSHLGGLWSILGEPRFGWAVQIEGARRLDVLIL